MMPDILIRGAKDYYQGRLSFELAISLADKLPDRSVVKSSALDFVPVSARWVQAEGTEDWSILVEWFNRSEPD